MSRLIALDTETTGLDTAQDRIVEIAAVEILDGFRVKRIFHRRINPERDIPRDVEAVHGLSAEILADEPTFTQIAADLIAFIGDSPLLIHNAAFDSKILSSELERCGRLALSNECIDTLTMARARFPGAANNLAALCQRLEIRTDNKRLHCALDDALLLVEVLGALNGNRQSCQKGSQSDDDTHPNLPDSAHSQI